MLGSWWDQRRQAKTEFAEAMGRFEDALRITHQDLEESRREDVESRHAQYPPIDQVIAGALRRDGSLWMRRPEPGVPQVSARSGYGRREGHHRRGGSALWASGGHRQGACAR